jgi:hypothetical protein
MKHIDYLYFNIYNHFYRISLYKQSLNVRIQAMYLFSLGSGGWLLMLEALYLHTIRHSWFPSRSAASIFAFFLYILSAALFNYIYIVKDRDLKIFDKYEDLSESNPRRRRHLIISMAVLMVPYLVLISFAIIFPKHS